jgi:RNA polymerase sigma factor (sigma-70 family)
VKDILDEYFNRNYKFLLEVIGNINNKGVIPFELYKDLLFELYLHCIKKIDVLEQAYKDKGENGIKGYCIRWIKNQSYWWSDFKKLNNLHIDRQIEYVAEKDERLYLQSDETDEYYKDLETVHSPEQIDKIKQIKKIYETLEQYEKNLYDMLIIEKMTMEQISIKVGISKGSVHSLVKNLKEKIKSKIK